MKTTNKITYIRLPSTTRRSIKALEYTSQDHILQDSIIIHRLIQLITINAIHTWPRHWWRAMYARANLLPIRRKKDRCAQISLDSLQCFKKHGHQEDCRWGEWVGGLNILRQEDTKDPLDGAFIRRKRP